MIKLTRLCSRGYTVHIAIENPDLRGQAELVPFSVLKGGFLPGRVFLEDAIIASSKHPATPSDPKNIVGPNPDALSGGCRRNVFNKGAIVVAFLQEKNGKYIVHAPALSRALEDVPSSDALWVKAVKVYIQIAKFPISQRRKEILSKISQLTHVKTDPDSEIIANDLKNRYLIKCNFIDFLDRKRVSIACLRHAG